MNPTARTPSYRHHKASNQGFVELDGRRIYLGKWGLPETEQRYHRLIGEWLANGRRVPVAPEEISVSELAARYWQHCTGFYGAPNGKPSAHLAVIRAALAPLRQMYGCTNAADFGPKAIRVLQSHFIDKHLGVSTINRNISIVRRMFKWAASHEFIPVMIAHGLGMVENLTPGRSAARDPKHIAPVSDEHVNAIRDIVAPPVWALIQLQRLTGARSGELLPLRPCDIDRSGSVWTATLEHHKTAHRGHSRVLHFGPQAQAVLRPFLLRASDVYLFSPKESAAWRAARCKKHRRPKQKPNPKATMRVVRDRYGVDSYARAMHRACLKADIPSWHPHQLRHTAATRIRQQFGIEAAQVALGHSRIRATEVYAERDMSKAAIVAGEIG